MTDSSTSMRNNESIQESTDGDRYPHQSLTHETKKTAASNEVDSSSSNSKTLMLPPEKRWSHVLGRDIGDHDLVLGRGIGKSHQGNLKFRALIRQYKFKYLAAPKVHKPRVAEEVVRVWRGMNPPGRFLARIETNPVINSGDIEKGIWHDVGDKKAREKASMSLRERTPETLPFLKHLQQCQEQQANVTSNQAIRSFERELGMVHNHGPMPHHPVAPRWIPPGPSPPPMEPEEASRHMLPPPRRMSTPGGGGAAPNAHPAERVLPPLPPAAAANAAGGWRDYSSRSGTGVVRRERDLSPLRNMDGGLHQQQPRTVLEAQQQAEIRAMHRRIEQQQKMIDALEKQLRSNKQHDATTEVTPQSTVSGQGSSLQGIDLVVSPVPYTAAGSGTTQANDENDESGLENYQILLDCLRADDAEKSGGSKNEAREEVDTTKVSLLRAVQSPAPAPEQKLAVLRTTPLQPSSVVARENNQDQPPTLRATPLLPRSIAAPANIKAVERPNDNEKARTTALPRHRLQPRSVGWGKWGQMARHPGLEEMIPSPFAGNSKTRTSVEDKETNDQSPSPEETVAGEENPSPRRPLPIPSSLRVTLDLARTRTVKRKSSSPGNVILRANKKPKRKSLSSSNPTKQLVDSVVGDSYMKTARTAVAPRRSSF